MKVEDLLTKLEREILLRKTDSHPMLVSVNGLDGSGKTFFSQKLKDRLLTTSRNVVVISIDDFHNPKSIRYQKGEETPEAFYHDSINYDAFIELTLNPLSVCKKFPITVPRKIFDLDSDQQSIVEIEVISDHIIIFEGIFLFKNEMVDFFDYKIFLDADFSVTLERMIKRDLPASANQEEKHQYIQRTEKKYRPGQKMYLSINDPKSKADIIIDNSDFENPVIQTKF